MYVRTRPWTSNTPYDYSSIGEACRQCRLLVEPRQRRGAAQSRSSLRLATTRRSNRRRGVGLIMFVSLLGRMSSRQKPGAAGSLFVPAALMPCRSPIVIWVPCDYVPWSLLVSWLAPTETGERWENERRIVRGDAARVRHAPVELTHWAFGTIRRLQTLPTG